MSNVKKISNNAAAIHLGGEVYTVAANYRGNDWQRTVLFDNKHNWERDPTYVMGKKIVPYGTNNDLPVVIRKVMDENALAPGIIEREIGLLFGNGPALYRLEFGEDGIISRRYVRDADIEQWLKSWKFHRFLDMAMVEYKHLKGFFVRRFQRRGWRIGEKRFIKKLDVIPATDARFEWPDTQDQRMEDVRNIYVGDFENNCLRTGITRYPVYDHDEPWRHTVSLSYHNSYSFARNFYSVPGYYGALKWIMRSSEIPEIIQYLTENGIAAAFHIHSPELYWKRKRERLEEIYEDKPAAFIDQKLDELKTKIFDDISAALAGKKNAGKFIETVDFYDDEGNLCEWKIEPIDQKIKDFIEAQIKIGEKADSATTSSMGLHPSLSNIILQGQFSSGSQLLYALKAYLASDVNIPEEVIFEPINQAIEVNFPGKDYKLGFYRDIVRTESETKPDDRVRNTV